MKSVKKKNNMLFLAIIVIIVIAAFWKFSPKEDQLSIELKKQYDSLPTETAKRLFLQQSKTFTQSVDPALVELDKLTIGCFGPQKVMSLSSQDSNLGGQCCGALHNAQAYKEQLEALDLFIKENGNLDLIPKDPYNVPVEDAQKLTAWDSEITLTKDQQKVYDEAMAMSHHGGPCCCKCWKWYVMSGLAKKLIFDHNWNAHQITELWDTSSSCGHSEDTNMYQHYKKSASDHKQH